MATPDIGETEDEFVPLPVDLTQTLGAAPPTLSTRALHKQHHDAVHAAVNRLEQQIRPLIEHLTAVAETAQAQVAASEAEHASLGDRIDSLGEQVSELAAQVAALTPPAEPPPAEAVDPVPPIEPPEDLT